MVMSREYSAPNAALDTVAAVPQPSCPASTRVFLSDAANHRRLSVFRPANVEAIRIRVRWAP